MKAMYHAHTQPHTTTKQEKPQVCDVHKERRIETKHHHSHVMPHSDLPYKVVGTEVKWEAVVKSIFTITEHCKLPVTPLIMKEKRQTL